MKDKLGQEPAYPTIASFAEGRLQESYQIGNYEVRFSGISKRLYAACAAMQGIVSNPSVSINNDTIPFLVTKSYFIADELLKQEHETD